jgi:hypothetical protein
MRALRAGMRLHDEWQDFEASLHKGNAMWEFE